MTSTPNAEDVAEVLGIEVTDEELAEFSELKTLVAKHRQLVDSEHAASVIGMAMLEAFQLGKKRSNEVHNVRT